MNSTKHSSLHPIVEQYHLMDHLTLLNGLLTVVAILAFGVLHTLIVSPLKHVPGPFLAKFTNIWRLMSVLSRCAEKQQRLMHDRLGPAVRLGPNMVSISDPTMLSEIYSRKKVLQKSEFYAVNDINVHGRRVQNVFSTRDEQFNTTIMKPILKLFDMKNLIRMEPLIDQTISYCIQRLTEEFASTGKPCDMSTWLHYCAWDVLSEITFSRRMGFLEQATDIKGMLSIGLAGMDYFSVVGMIPWLDHFLDKNPVKRIGPPSFVPAVEFSIQRIIDRRTGADGHQKTATPDFLDGFLEAQKNNPETVTQETVVTYLMANVTAGADTVAVELRSIMYHLCKNKSNLARLQAELDQQIPQSSSEESPIISWEQTQTSLPFLCACVDEGIRLTPGVSLPLERVVSANGMTLSDGHTYLPPGTIVGVNPWVINRDRTVFGEDPHGFHPERWLKSDTESEAQHQERVTRMHNTDLTFGSGKRQCTGKRLALMECRKIVGSLVKVFDFELVDPGREWTTRNSWFMHQTDMDMRLKLRKG